MIEEKTFLKRLLQVREQLLMTKYETSNIQEINNLELYEIPIDIKSMIKQIFPDSTMIYSIEYVLNILGKVQDKNTTEIIRKLKKFNENEYVSLRNFLQIMMDEYFEIPEQLVDIFNDFHCGFQLRDTLKTGFISINHFSSVIKDVLKNNDIIEDILKPFDSVKYVDYEAWLLRKRESLYNMRYSAHIMLMKAFYLIVMLNNK
ncbi:uncharacterized protein LOC126893510 isoform X2 [Daktulosphaira vitifoliae]|uniref:uncharacterized protein LOC126893510 isoform X2 n=1 Tax=Daktulosphaira vitifoliae TaxID=58002 RepID=UPI0021AA7B1B|nr:uncharacterized protein LOC126893510 isoform X2 [Daktulosphaira vitifoliae]